MDFFVHFGCALQFIFWKFMKKLMLVLGHPFRDRKSLETKQTQVKPNANRGWPIKLVNHIRPQLTRLCPNSSWTPTSQNADGASLYWGFQPYASFGWFELRATFRYSSSIHYAIAPSTEQVKVLSKGASIPLNTSRNTLVISIQQNIDMNRLVYFLKNH